MLERGRSERVDSVLDDPGGRPGGPRRLAARTGLWVPLLVRGPRDRSARGPRQARPTTLASPTTTFASPRRSPTAPPSRSTCRERVARDALRRVVEAQELERRRLARELHDETGQALTSILLGLKALEEQLGEPSSREARSAELRELVVATLQDVRRLAVELRPSALDDFGLVAALERLTDVVRASRPGIAIDFESSLGDERLPSEVETALYRIVQESLTNVVKHARARHVSILARTRRAARSRP